MGRVKLCKVAKDSSEEGEAFTEENVGLFFPSVKLLNNLNTKFKMRKEIEKHISMQSRTYQ